MCLSQPQAGSSLSNITTRAEPREDGTYRLFGNKMWISCGDHELCEKALSAALGRLVEVTATLNSVTDQATRLANASLHLEAAGDVVLAWICLEQYLATGDGNNALLEVLDRTTLDSDPAGF